MADQKRTNSHRAGRPAPSRWRVFVTVAAGLALIASAYQVAFATGPVGFLPDYGPTTDTGDESGGSPGGVGGGTVDPLRIPVQRADDSRISAMAIGAILECRPTFPALPADHKQVSELELVTASSVLEAGTSACFHLHGRSAKDGRWYDLTDRPETRIELAGASHGVVRQQGSSHRYCLPVTATPVLSSVVVSGRFDAPGAPRTAEAQVRLQGVRVR
jgi:hypothetical protein